MQATLQFCFIKPVVAVVIIALEAFGYYNEGNWEYVTYSHTITLFYNFLLHVCYNYVVIISVENSKLNKVIIV